MTTFWKTFWAALLGVIVGFILHFILIMMLIVGLIGSLASSSSTTPVVSGNSVLKIDLSSSVLAERTSDYLTSFSLESLYLGGDGPTIGIYDAIRAIEKAATDPKIKMIYLYSDYDVNSSTANLEELRGALARFHDSGKPIIAYGMNYTIGSYYLATVADKIYMNTEGSAPIIGLGGSMLFFKDLIDKLGVNVQLIRHGKFKAAAEQFIASNISAENREQNEVLFKSMWNSWADEICVARGIDKERLDKAVDNLEIKDAKSMLSLNMIDEIFSTAEIDDKLCSLVGAEPEKGYNTISLSTYAQTVPRSYKAGSKIALLYADGEINMTGVTDIAATSLIKDINKIRKDENVKAVVFRVNSPGGDAQAADVIRTEIQRLREVKPVVVSYGEYAASGGYWISAECDKIFTDNTTVTGSIGVFSMSISVGDALKKNLKINSAQIGTHQHSAMMSGMEPLNAQEIEYIQHSVENIYTKFTNIVANGRKMDVNYVDSVGQGRIWSGADAITLRLADAKGGLKEALDYAAQLVDQSTESSDYSIVEYPRLKTQMETLLETFQGTTNESVLNKKVRAFIERYKGTHTYARLPYIYKIDY